MVKEVKMDVVFYRTDAEKEPVREWLQDLPKPARRTIGTDIKTVQFGWPLGMPLVRKLEANLWEIRSTVDQRVARILFTIVQDHIVLLHGFVKKSQKTPQADLELARKRKSKLNS
jgi:phage-related protein